MENEVISSTPAPAAQTDFQKWASLPEAEAETETPSAAEPAKPATEARTSTPASDPETEDGQESEEEIPTTPKGLSRRFRELTTKIKNLEAAAKAKPEPQATPAAATPKVDAPAGELKEPQSKDFDSYEAYSKELVKYEVEKIDRDRQAKAATERAQREAEERGQNWQRELTAARERYADFDAVALTDMPINQATHNAIVESGKDGAELAYYLGQHRDEAAAIVKLSPTATQLALGKILAKISSEETPETTTTPAAVSRAPRPPKAVNGSAGADLGREPDPKDFAKWARWKDRQEAAEA